VDEQQLIAENFRYVEAPRWHNGQLWFSDVHDFRLKAVTPEGSVTVVAEIPDRPSGLGLLPDKSWLLATGLTPKLLKVTGTGESSAVADLAPLTTGSLNDMVVEANGRAFVGDTGFRMGTEAPRPGRIITWKAGEGAHVVAEDVVFPNGCVITPDGSQLLVAETLARRISRFAISADGSLSNRVLHATLDSEPDGMCLDASGGLWVALPLAGVFVYVAAEGTVSRRIRSVAPFAVSCMLGGSDRRTLFLCSAYTDLQRLARADTTARIDAIEVPVAGAGWP